VKFVASTVVLGLFACCFRRRLLYKTAEIWYFCTRRGRRNHENDNSYLERPIHLAEQLRVIKQNYISMRLMFKDQSADCPNASKHADVEQSTCKLQLCNYPIHSWSCDAIYLSTLQLPCQPRGHVVQSIFQLYGYYYLWRYAEPCNRTSALIPRAFSGVWQSS